MTLRPAAELSHAQLAALFTAAYEDYFIPVAIDEASLRFIARAWDYDLEASLVARDDDAGAVGLAMLARRGADGWIGGVGVVPERRAEGVGRELMDAVADQARARGVKRLWLEVLVENAPAIGLYENTEDAQALAAERGTLIYRISGGTVSLFQVGAADEGAVRDLLAALPAETTGVRYLNGPTGDPVNAALKSLGAVESVRQQELVLHL